MIRVLYKEFSSFLSSLIAYIVIGIFLIAIGLILWVFPDTSVLDYGYADLSSFFGLVPYVLMFLIPAITMRSFSEERKSGTLEFLFTKPLTEWDIVLGKFFASFLLVLVALLPTLLYYFSLTRLSDPPGNVDTPGIMGSYIGLILLSAVFCGVGIFSSALSSNQIVSFVVAVFLTYLLYAGFDALADLNAWSSWEIVIRELGVDYHYTALSRGLIDSRDVIYSAGLTGFLLLATRAVLRARLW